jgi:hypothetical protein
VPLRFVHGKTRSGWQLQHGRVWTSLRSLWDANLIDGFGEEARAFDQTSRRSQRFHQPIWMPE